MAHPVTWFQISGKNGKKLQSFYKRLFSWKMAAAPGDNSGLMMVDPDLPGGIAGGIGPSQDGSPSVTVYVTVDDVEAHLQKIEAAGGKTAMQPQQLPQGMGTIGGFTDPEGNWVGLWQPGEPPPQKSVTKAAKKSRPRTKPAGKGPAKTKANSTSKPAKAGVKSTKKSAVTSKKKRKKRA
jgi:predicted enzyme related to lactoylglutathione lyase